MRSVNTTQNLKINNLFTIVTALGALTAFLLFLEGRRHRKISEDVAQLDKEIKQLQLLKLKNGDK